MALPVCCTKKKDWRDRSDKECVCGGHSFKDVKKNKNHNTTKSRLSNKANRKFKEEQLKTLIEYEREYFSNSFFDDWGS